MENKNTNNNIRLGLFVSIGIALFILAIYFIGDKQHLFSKTIRLSSMFKDIGGLQIGNNVRFSGINVGTIDDIVIVSDSLVRVDVIIEKKVQKFIKKNAKATIGSEGLMGNKVLNISPGIGFNQPIIRDNDTINTLRLASMDDIMMKMDSVAGNAVYITNDLKAMLSNVHAGKGTLGKLFMDDEMAKSMGATMNNIKKSTSTLDDNLVALQSNFLFKKGIKKQQEQKQARADSITAARTGKTIKEVKDAQKKKSGK